MNHKWITAHVELCLQDVWNCHRVEQDADGDFPYRCETAAGYVRVEGGRVPLVRVFAVAAHGVPRSAKLLTELNQVNASSRSAHVYWQDGTVYVEEAMPASSAERHSLTHACRSVGKVADDIGSLVAAVFGGSTPYQSATDDVDDADFDACDEADDEVE